MLPGTYTVSVTAEGFKTQVQDNVVLPAGASPVLNFSLEVGGTSETVTVSGTAELLDAENSVGNNELTTRELENIPLNGRQVYTMLGTLPGSQFLQTQFGASGYSGTRGWDVSNNYTLGGGVQSYQQFTLNGSNITMQNNGAQGTWELAPNVDALQEVNVQTTNYDARYGRSGGGFVSMVVKSGSNQFHGSAYEFLENGVLNANNFENNLNGIPRQGVTQNQFGGTFGGPVKKKQSSSSAASKATGRRFRSPPSPPCPPPTCGLRAVRVSTSRKPVTRSSTPQHWPAAPASQSIVAAVTCSVRPF